MGFIGQESIIGEIDTILPVIKNSEENINILFRAASGYGKTTLAFLCLNYLGFDNSYMYLPEDGKLVPQFRRDKRFHFIDEVHTLESPEFLYPILDSGKYTFIFATNESGDLKEPLLNRCIQFIFSPYSEENITQIVRECLGENISNEYVAEISSRSRLNPRVAKILCKRLNLIFKNRGVPQEMDDLRNLLTNFLNIKEGGINKLDEIYLEYLKSAGGRSSLTNITWGSGIDRSTILREVEPFLLVKGIIRITSKGRELCMS